MSRRWVLSFLLIVCVFFGGGGSPSPFSELIVQFCALAALAIFFWRPTEPFSWPETGWDKAIVAGFAAVVALPLLQIIPLPPSIWHALPNRQTEIESLRLVGAASTWRPLSIDPQATFASALSLIPPIAVIMMMMQTSVGERSMLLKFVAGAALAAAVVGVIQLASATADWLRFYRITNYGFATGFQANRNADADLLIIGFIAFAACVALDKRLQSKWSVNLGIFGVGLFILLSVVTTGSRTGVALAALTVAMLGVVLLPYARNRLPRRSLLFGAVVAVALCVVGFAILQNNDRLSHTWQRFSQVGDARTADIWPDTLYVIGQAWPAGTGIGSFVPSFEAGERLEVVDRSRPNRAHNDYLEFALEAGVAGIALLGLIAVGLAWRVVQVLRTSRSFRRRTQAMVAGASLLILGLHSLVDYPMRSMSLAVLAAFAVGLLSTPRGEFGPRREPGLLHANFVG